MSRRRKELEASWARTRAYLADAFSRLPPSPVAGGDGGSVEAYREWLHYNELELALDELEMLGEGNRVDRSFWECLLQAAIEMELEDHAARYREMLAGRPPQ